MYENMEFVSKRTIDFFDNERTINKQILNTNIQGIFDKKGYSSLKLKTIFESLRFTGIEKIAINEVIWDLKYIHKIPIVDVVLYLLQFSDPVKVLKVFNSEQLTELKTEIKKNNKRIRSLDNNKDEK